MSGRQPQEKSLGDSILEKRKRQDAEIVAEGNFLPSEILQEVNDQKAKFLKVKSDIDVKMTVVNQTLEEVRQTIRDNLQSENNLNGVLTCKEIQYISCLELKQHRGLEQLFKLEVTKLDESIESARREARELKRQIDTYINKSRTELEAILM